MNEELLVDALAETNGWYLRRALRNYNEIDSKFAVDLITRLAEEEGIFVPLLDVGTINSFSFDSRESSLNNNFNLYLKTLSDIRDGSTFLGELVKSLSFERRAFFYDPLASSLLNIRDFFNDVLGHSWNKSRRLSDKEIDGLFINSFGDLEKYLSSIETCIQKTGELNLLAYERNEDFNSLNFYKKYLKVVLEPILYREACIFRDLAGVK